MSPRLPLSDLFLRAQPDERLAALAAQGHERAFGALVERHRRGLTRCARRLTGAGREEDVVQQALLSSWRALQQGAEVQRVEPWLYRIVHNAAIRDMAHRERQAEPLGPELLESHRAPNALDRRLEARELLRSIAGLPERQRLALVGTEFQGRSRQDLAQELGLSEGAVRQLVHRARVAMRATAAAVIPTPWLLRAASGSGAAGRGGGADMPETLLAGASASGVGAAGALIKAGTIVLTASTLAGGLAHKLVPRERPSHRSAPSLTAHAALPSAAPGTIPAHAPRAVTALVVLPASRAISPPTAPGPAPARPAGPGRANPAGGATAKPPSPRGAGTDDHGGQRSLVTGGGSSPGGPTVDSSHSGDGGGSQDGTDRRGSGASTFDGLPSSSASSGGPGPSGGPGANAASDGASGSGDGAPATTDPSRDGAPTPPLAGGSGSDGSGSGGSGPSGRDTTEP